MKIIYYFIFLLLMLSCNFKDSNKGLKKQMDYSFRLPDSDSNFLIRLKTPGFLLTLHRPTNDGHGVVPLTRKND